MWQDYVLATTSVVFVAALIPTLRSATKVPWWTAGPTAYALATNAVVLFTLSMPFAAGTTLVMALMWQRIATRRADELKGEAESSCSGFGLRVLVPSDSPPELTVERSPDK